MTIKDGYGGMPTKIRISAREERKAEVWIEQHDKTEYSFRTETLAYATLGELLDLRDEINAVIKELVA